MEFILPVISVLITICGFIMHLGARKKAAAATEADTPVRPKKLGMVVFIFGIWLVVGSAITLIFGSPAQPKFGIDIIPPRAGFTIGSYQPSQTMLVGWGVTAALIIGAVILRIFFIPKLSDVPGKLQNAVEMLVETVESYSSGYIRDLGRPMFGFIFVIGITLIGNVVAELMGFRSPSSDLMFTIALALSVFLMANWYGLRKLSLVGRIKNLANPSPVLMPIRFVTDIINPFSMACRLFGNTVSGLIVMNLIYSALGNFSSAIPSVVGLYFNVFTALIQTVIFITLSLSSINDATTEAAD